MTYSGKPTCVINFRHDGADTSPEMRFELLNAKTMEGKVQIGKKCIYCVVKEQVIEWTNFAKERP